jgi:hypothetical protein
VSRWLPGAGAAADRPLPRPGEDEARGLLSEPDEALATDARGEAGGAEPPLPLALRLCAEALAAAGPSLRRLPLGVRAAAIARVSRSWRDPRDPFRREAIERLPGECGLSPEMVAWGMDRAWEEVEERALLDWWRRQGPDGLDATGAPDGAGPPPTAGPPPLSAHVWAGNVFVSGLPPVLASLLAGVPAVVKAPSRHPSFAALLARSFALHAPELGPCLGAAAWPRSDEGSTAALLEGADRVFAWGDDASVAALRDRTAADRASARRFYGFSHRYSIAVATRAGLAEAVADPRHSALEGLALDALAWDGGGCLSPRWAFVEGSPDDAQRLARLLCDVLPAVAARLPAGQPADPAPAAAAAAAGVARAAWLAHAGFAGWSRGGSGWGVAAVAPQGADALSQPALASAPGRCVPCVAVPGLEPIRALLAPLGPRLQGMALLCAADERRAREAHARALLEPLGLSRIAPPGRLQTPPLSWEHDGVRILAAAAAAAADSR